MANREDRNMGVQILDCTLRDGGYYCDWDYEDSTVSRYLDAVVGAGVSVVEVGFRSKSNAKDGFMGKFKFCPESVLKPLFQKRSIRVAVMIDGKNFISDKNIDDRNLDVLFNKKPESLVDLVRVTTTKATLDPVLKIGKWLKERGYEVSINVMQASLLSEKLAESGAEVIEIPTIKVVSQKADKRLKNAFSAGKYDWVFFTSQNGVYEFAEFLKREGKDSRIFGKAKICAIGSETAKSLHTIGVRPDYLPSQFIAEAVVKHFKNIEFKGPVAPKALILRAKKARDILPKGLKEAGFEVKIIDLYDTVLPKESVAALKQAFKDKVDFITFTSSSTVENFIKLMGKGYKHKLSGVKFASIGPITSSTLKEYGLKAGVEAKVYTIEGLVKAMVNPVRKRGFSNGASND